MKVQLLATDMDGTLLDDYKRLTEKNCLALQGAHDQGIQVVLCTGRPYQTVKPYLTQLAIPCWLITNNGAVIRDPKGNVLHTSYLRHETLIQVIQALETPPHLYYHGSDDHYTYVKSRWQRMKNIFNFERRSLKSRQQAAFHAVDTVLLSGLHRKVNYAAFLQNGGQLANLIVISPDEEALKIKRQQLEKIPNLFLTRSGHDNLEILDRHTTKGNALAWLCRHLNLEMGNVAAIGDHENDVSMITMAGFGFATENAVTTAKEQAMHITCSNNEGALWEMVTLLELKKQAG
ncbi:Cof-type HAD-IIB family hydrolase [Anoxynatronum buryatiense]|uniref:Phosphoglycolate phosphatase n=1 Tax=Anoxynatronum buryatiense TaxID=489973 RepID=A0AA45WTE3_9CLOT|nr:Cof-type HAD-IIB family hydrolase [Anoxynatronum buryatiense]SMP41410.1 phosphoglycolate phosphatase [Anoxynatronum buryatiense]